MTVHLHEPIAFPDIEASLVAWIPTVLAGVTASTRIPNPRPARFVRVLRTGGPRAGLVVDQAQVTFECWHDDSVKAGADATTLRAHVGALVGARIDGVQILGIDEMSGPANLPDPTSKQARYTFTAMIGSRGRPL